MMGSGAGTPVSCRFAGKDAAGRPVGRRLTARVHKEQAALLLTRKTLDQGEQHQETKIQARILLFRSTAFWRGMSRVAE